jgi:hypothetical protein
MPDFDHWLITRFNVPFRRYLGTSTDPDWLDHRMRLFVENCLPSVAHQSCQDFRWLLLVDRKTPRRRLKEILALAKTRAFELHAVGFEWGDDAAKYLARERRSEYLLTSRLDNDDAIHRDYLRTVQGGFVRQTFEFLELPNGLKLDEGRRDLYRFRRRSGPFLTLVERVVGSPATVYCCNHTRATELGPLRTLDLEHAWLQVVHGWNIVNQIPRDLSRVPSSELGGGFPWFRPSE